MFVVLADEDLADGRTSREDFADQGSGSHGIPSSHGSAPEHQRYYAPGGWITGRIGRIAGKLQAHGSTSLVTRHFASPLQRDHVETG